MNEQDTNSLKKEEIFKSSAGNNIIYQEHSTKTRKWKRPLIGSIIILILLFLIFTLYVYTPKSLQLSKLSQEDPPIVDTPDLSFWERISNWYEDNKFDLPDFDFNTDNDNDDGGGGLLGDFGSSVGNLLLLLLMSLIAVAVVYGLFRIFTSFKGVAFQTSMKKKESKKQKITALGERIRKIINRIDQLYEEGEYSQGIIVGYQMLDEALSDYIQLRRRKYDTPLEHVLQSEELHPINKSVLQGIVNEFYLEQYAMEGLATKNNLEGFRQMIIRLIPEEELGLISTHINGNSVNNKGGSE
ncbi:MAG: hypothetical protein KAR35_00270 [Candidatus Heimdallarchaeota archaeon]|nr:hypothetical protein [Candidatus Heimdallarchaeota archaeon]MCK5047785.1 hypothetical protein [Candidatus Heimdallarchaeota archaeon]